MVSRAEYDLDRARQMVGIAEAFLAGEIGGIETARSIQGLREYRGEDTPEGSFDVDPALEDVFETFDLVNSETDALPIGDVRKLWNKEALLREDIEIAKSEAWCRQMVADACRNLIDVLRRYERENS
jgi:hypothetical protein